MGPEKSPSCRLQPRGSERRTYCDFLCVSCRGFRESAQNLAEVGTTQPQVGTNDHQVVTNPPIARITPLLSMRVSVCLLEGGIFDGCWFNPAGQWLKPVVCKVSREGNALFVHCKRIPGVSDFP